MIPEDRLAQDADLVSAQATITLDHPGRAPTREALTDAAWDALAVLRNRWRYG